MADLNKLTIRGVSDGLRAKKFSAEEVAKDCFARIEARNGDVNAFVTVTEEIALKGAREVDKRLAAGEDDGVLMGVPMGVKDLFNTAGTKTTCCSPGLKDFVPAYNATVVDRLADAGAVMLGKTNMDEFACGASTEYSCFGVTKNPVDLSKVAGGSSGGSGAAVADDMAIFALGTDTGGSIRQPASFCGTYGLKVTYGRVSRSGVTAMASSWDTVGTFGKGVEDIAYVLQAIAGKDRRDMTTPDVAVPDYTKVFGKGVKGM